MLQVVLNSDLRFRLCSRRSRFLDREQVSTAGAGEVGGDLLVVLGARNKRIAFPGLNLTIVMHVAGFEDDGLDHLFPRRIAEADRSIGAR